jgi:hypothetical protein
MATSQQKPSSKRMASWVYHIINPILDAMATECHLLQNENLSWQFYNKQTEFISRIEEYIDFQQHHNYRHFLTECPHFAQLFKEHDEVLREAANLAAEILASLTGVKIFTDLVYKKLAEYMQTEAYPGGAVPQAKFHELMVEHLVNGVEELLVESDSEFWAQYSDALKTTARQLYPQLFAKLKEAKQKLLGHAQAIQQKLEGYSYSLCKEYDIPGDPVVASSSHER